MKKKLMLIVVAFLGAGLLYFNVTKESEVEKERKNYAEFLKSHPYANREHISIKDLKKLPKRDRPDLAFEQDFLKTIDPLTGKLHKDRLLKAITASKKRSYNRRTITFNWESRGPKKVSGRTRAIMFDPNDATNKKVFAGGVGGGIWKNNDITDANSEWIHVYPEMSNFSISSMAYDPVITSNFYVGTGEGWRNYDAINGAGIWKSTDAGVNWSNLSATTNFKYVFDFVIRNEGGAEGVIYAGITNSNNTTGLYQSVDGGEIWTIVLNESIRDLEIASDNKLWASNGKGQIFNSTDGINWTTVYSSSLENPDRVELAIAPSNANKVYALIAKRVEDNSRVIGEIISTNNAGTSWTNLGTGPNDSADATIPADDFTRGQAWYDLIAAVNPSNEDEVYIGAINSFKSSNGGATWVKISSWESYYDNSVSYVHADHHNIVFRPGNNNQLVITTDGGVFYAPDLSILPTSGSNAFTTGIEERNLNYNVTQFYSAAIDPINTNIFIGGSQDNGSIFFSESGISNTNQITGGDGAFSFIDQTATTATEGYYQITSVPFNYYYLYDYTLSSPQKWIQISASESGSFINPADYDDVNNVLYSFNGNNEITTTILNADGADQGLGENFLGTTAIIAVNELTNQEVTHIRVSPYNEANRALFIGTSAGIIIKRTSDGTITEITNSLVTGAVSSIEVGISDNELLATYSNYGVVSVWYSEDGGLNWKNKEGNLPDMPVRWSLFNSLDRTEVLLATEVGVWRTSDITATVVSWEPASIGMGNVRVDMLQYRESDNLVLAATHGRGMFTSNFTTETNSVNDVLADKKAFTIYPTVSNGNFTVFARNTLGKTKVNIFDINGREVYKSNIDFTKNNKQQVSVNLNTGIYMVNLIDENNKKSSSKIVIE